MSTSSIRYIHGTCALGDVLLAFSDKGLCALLLGDDLASLEQDLARRFAGKLQRDEGLAPALEQTLRHLDNPHLALDLPLDLAGSAFQRQVWEALRQIPVGQTASYREIAQRLDQPQAFSCGGQCLRGEPGGGDRAVSSGVAPGWKPWRLSLGTGTQTAVAGS